MKQMVCKIIQSSEQLFEASQKMKIAIFNFKVIIDTVFSFTGFSAYTVFSVL